MSLAGNKLEEASHAQKRHGVVWETINLSQIIAMVATTKLSKKLDSRGYVNNHLNY